MKKMTKKAENTLLALQKKANGDGRMPSLKKVHELLCELGIEHEFESTSYSPDIRPAGCPYRTRDGVERHGYDLVLKATLKNGRDVYEHMDSTDAYYSWNTFGYARSLLAVIND